MERFYSKRQIGYVHFKKVFFILIAIGLMILVAINPELVGFSSKNIGDGFKTASLILAGLLLLLVVFFLYQTSKPRLLLEVTPDMMYSLGDEMPVYAFKGYKLEQNGRFRGIILEFRKGEEWKFHLDSFKEPQKVIDKLDSLMK